MDMFNLFLRCLTVKYKSVGCCANYAFERENNVLYIFFEGSEGIVDWIKNLNFPAKPYKKMKGNIWYAHRGFVKAWKELEPLLKKVIEDKSIKKIIITGYSHGAAIAVLCHEYIWYNRKDLQETLQSYGFGCPRVLWGNVTQDIKNRWKRFVVVRNINDIVTHLPPSFLGFFHVGKMLEIGQKKKYNCFQAHNQINILKELKIYEKDK